MAKKDNCGTVEYAGLRFRVVVRRVRHSRIQFGEEGPVLVLPPGTNPLAVLERKRSWILKTRDRLSERLAAAGRLSLFNRSWEELRELVAGFVSEYSRILAVAPGEIKYRKMSRRWGSCRSDGVITLNRRLCYLPERLVAYVVFHELLHLRLRRHDARFRQMMRDQFSDARARDAELEIYGYRILYRSSPLGRNRRMV